MSRGFAGRGGAAIAMVAAWTVACSGASPPPTPTSSTSPPTPAVQRLHVNFDQPAERWRTVATFTYGERVDQLGPPGGSAGTSGLHPAGGALPFPPGAIAYASNSIWVLDQIKKRVAHFTLDGRYLGQVTGVSATASDLAIAPPDEFVVIDDETRATVRTFTATSKQASRARAVIDRAGNLPRLVPTDTDLGAWFAPIELIDPPEPDDGLYPLVLSPPRLDKTTSGAREGPDLLSTSMDRNLLRIDMSPEWDRKLQLTSRHRVSAAIQSTQVTGGFTYLWLVVGETRIHGAGGQFLLVFDAYGNVKSFERVATPDDAFDSEVDRPFAATSDSQVYQWFATPTHAELRARP